MRLEELQAAARELPHHEPSPAQRDAMRAALLEAARAMPPLRPRRAAPALAAAATAVTILSAAGLMLWWSGRPAGRESPRATIQSSSGAHFEHTRQEVTRERGKAAVEEVVRLREGRVAVAVDHLTDGERFRVLTSDAEVEVRGTAFDVLVERDRLIEVAVSSGRVDVRPRGRRAVSLAAGERWRADAGVVVEAVETAARAGETTPAPAPAPTTAPKPAPMPPTTAPVPAPTVPAPTPARAVDTAPAPATGPAPAPARTGTAPARTTRTAPTAASRASTEPARTPARATPTRTVPAPRTGAPPSISTTTTVDPAPELVTPRPMPTPSETAFGHGFRALRQGNYGEAAAQFELAIRDAPASPLAADARYWRAVTLARSGAGRGARAALADFLARHPTHARAGEASAMLGWILLDAGDPAAAAVRFRAALRDPDREVRASAERGMARIRAPR